jgi:hypothetical protein
MEERTGVIRTTTTILRAGESMRVIGTTRTIVTITTTIMTTMAMTTIATRVMV